MTEEAVKQEGEFKIKTPSKPKNLGNTEEKIVKVNMKEPLVDLEPDVKKVVIKNEDDAVQTQETNDSDVVVEEPKDGSDSERVVEEVRTTEEEEVESPITLVDQSNEEDVKTSEKQVTTEVEESTAGQKKLPENIDKLVSFMEETGGSIEDYVRLNADYTNVDDNSLIREYYKQTKPHLDSEDISLLIEDFSYDEDIDEPKDIRKKKIAFKEEVAKAKSFLEGLKDKYYDEIKLRPGVTNEQKEAVNFFNRYKEEQQSIAEKQKVFLDKTSNLFNNNFEGFDFKIGENKFRYNIKNPEKVAKSQSNISEFVGKFLNNNGEIEDTSGYHKALYAARNADTIAQHFYEQGKADATKNIMAKSKNISTEPRQTASGDVFIGGLKVKAVSGVDSSKLKIKTKKFN